MFEAMNWADYVIIGILAVSTILSLLRGFVREALSLAVWILGFWVALTYSSDLAEHLAGHITTPSIRMGVSFALLFVLVLFIGSFINYLLSQVVRKTGLSGTDRLLGMIFGVLRGILLVALLMLLASFSTMPADPWWKESKLMPYFNGLTNWLKSSELSEYITEQFSMTSPQSLLEAAVGEKSSTASNNAVDDDRPVNQTPTQPSMPVTPVVPATPAVPVAPIVQPQQAAPATSQAPTLNSNNITD